jgi:CRISPR-associated endonuclease/helicase Cas3
MPSTEVALSPFPSFEEFFRSAWGVDPFVWQRQLAERVSGSDGAWPTLLDVPTGLGKTAALDVFVWNLAADADRSMRISPTRAAFVIDRRLVVDSAFTRMRELTKALHQATDGPLFAVASRLRRLSGSMFPLVVQRMRGGISWEANWVRRPDQPAIVCGTVDQIGSRLLNRGYGSSRNRMPIDCGLLGRDCLLLLDEAHLSSAMVDTIRRVEAIELRSGDPVLTNRSGKVVRLTATPNRDDSNEDVLRVTSTSGDAIEGSSAQRLNALKLTSLLAVKRPEEVSEQMASLAQAMVGSERPVVLVVANTIRQARAVFSLLPHDAQGFDTHLLIGRCRSFERDQGESQWLERASANRDPAVQRHPLILVATQTVEVGVDIDVDMLISECAGVDALIQRFGRVDRLGRRKTTHSFVIGCPTKLGDDPVYGEAALRTWELLADVAAPASQADIKVGKKGPTLIEKLQALPTFDAGPLAFRELLDAQRSVAPFVRRPAPAPVVVGPTLSCWARSWPIPDPDESVAPYLHGAESVDQVASVAWRAPVNGDLKRSLEQFPLRGAELLEIPFVSLMRFLSGNGAEALSDLEALATTNTDAEVLEPRVEGLVVRSRTEIINVRKASDVRPGDVVVLPSVEGGHDAFGWNHECRTPVPDIGDLVLRSGVRLRLDADVLSTLGIRGAALRHAVAAVKAVDLGDGRSVSDSELAEMVYSVVDEISAQLLDRKPTESLYTDERLLEVCELLRSVEAWKIHGSPDLVKPTMIVTENSDGKVVPNALWMRLDSSLAGDSVEATNVESMLGAVGDDDEDSSLVGDAVAGAADADLTLRRHSVDVAERAYEIAMHAGLHHDLAESLRFAGFLHDLGKADRRFQLMLQFGVDQTGDGSFGQLYAKSGLAATDVERAKQATRASGWPRLRHEAISLALARHWPADCRPAGVDGDLALHLIATHHGYGRPWYPTDRHDHRPVQVALRIAPKDLPAWFGATEPIDIAASSSEGLMAFDQPARLERLRKRYGFWGLSYLESVLRLADVSISEELGWQMEGAHRG